MIDNNSFHIGKCDVCGKEGLIALLPSFLNRDETYSYCSDCMKQKAEPYDSCVSIVFAVGWENLSPSYQDVVKRSLDKVGKTLDDLFEDAAKLDNAYVEWCESELGSNEQAPIKYIPHWITHGENQDVFECSECHEEVWDEKTPYCPYCGVKMEVDNAID